MSRAHILQENSVAYLCKVLHNLPKSVPISTIESLYLTRCCEIAEKESLNLPEIVKSRVRCPRCFVQYAHGYQSSTVIKARRKNRFAQKLIKKIEKKKSLTSYQASYLKTNKNKKNFNSNTLVEICKFCNYKRKTHLQKPEKVINQLTNVSIKHKKKRKKDKFAGLNKDVVLNIQSKSDLKEIKSDTDVVTNISSKIVTPPQKELSIRAKKRKLASLKSMLRGVKEEKASTPLQQFLTSI